ncbi:hypothetical protein LguiA_030221 [Lonicera macranthoides]
MPVIWENFGLKEERIFQEKSKHVDAVLEKFISLDGLAFLVCLLQCSKNRESEIDRQGGEWGFFILSGIYRG